MANIKKKSQEQKLIVNDIRLINVDRTMKDIGVLRDSLRNAESIYYPNRTRLYDVYSDVTLDGHLTGIINKRMDAVLNKGIKFFKDDKEIEEMETFLESAVFRDIVTEILNVKFWGLSGMEFIPGTDVGFECIPRKHIKIEREEITIQQSDIEGIPYKGVRNIWVIGKKRDFGLLLQCSPYALYKKGDFGDWAQYVEIFGQPVRIAKYDANDIKTKTELKRAIDEAGSSLAIMIPKQAEFEMLDGKMSNGDGQLQERLKDACNDEMSIVILGNTETTSNNNGGSNAKAKEHGKQQLEVTKSDMAFVLTQLNSPKFIDILKDYNLPVDGGKFKFEKEMDLTALSQKIIIDKIVSEIVPVGDDYFYDTYGLSKPDDYAVRRKQMDDAKVKENSIEPPKQPDNPQPGKKTDKKNAKAETPKLNRLDRWKMWVIDFFDRAHKG